ncbi:MAG: HPr family phosphocarrier protein [Planctomycetota bacterium]|nr:HPr family phosphocarrier protein [Planctomycetota bacterium]
MHRSVKVINDAGLHARPCHAVVRLALEFEASLRVRFAGLDVNGKSILELMTLAAGKGEVLDLEAEGPDAEALLAAIDALIATGFEE